MCNAEVLACQAIQKIAGDGFARGITNAVDKAVKLGLMQRQIGKQFVNLGIVTDIAVKNQR